MIYTRNQKPVMSLTVYRSKTRSAVKFLHDLATQMCGVFHPDEIDLYREECRRNRDLLYAIIDRRVEVVKKPHKRRRK